MSLEIWYDQGEPQRAAGRVLAGVIILSGRIRCSPEAKQVRGQRRDIQ
jgi:hypothetical protein